MEAIKQEFLNISPITIQPADDDAGDAMSEPSENGQNVEDAIDIEPTEHVQAPITIQPAEDEEDAFTRKSIGDDTVREAVTIEPREDSQDGITGEPALDQDCIEEASVERNEGVTVSLPRQVLLILQVYSIVATRFCTDIAF